MHVFTLVITPGTRNTAIRKAFEILDSGSVRRYNYAAVGGRFADRLCSVLDTPEQKAERVDRRQALDAWWSRQTERQERRFRANTQRDTAAQEGPSDLSIDLVDVDELIEMVEEREHARHDPRPPDATDSDDCVSLISSLPLPLPTDLLPPLFITPNGHWHWRSLDGPKLEQWPRCVNRAIDRHRSRHCVVLMDLHM